MHHFLGQELQVYYNGKIFDEDFFPSDKENLVFKIYIVGEYLNYTKAYNRAKTIYKRAKEMEIKVNFKQEEDIQSPCTVNKKLLEITRFLP